jgi:hypothetical protein
MRKADNMTVQRLGKDYREEAKSYKGCAKRYREEADFFRGQARVAFDEDAQNRKRIRLLGEMAAGCEVAATAADQLAAEMVELDAAKPRRCR